MSVEVRVTSGASRQIRQLRAMQRRAHDPLPAWRKVGRYMAREIAKQFRTRGARFSTPWRPLAPSTIAEKRRLGYPRTPLVRTGALKREFTGRPLDIERYMGNVAFFGSNNPIAAYQHFGTRRNGRRHIPARPILKVTPDMRREVRQIFQDYIMGRET